MSSPEYMEKYHDNRELSTHPVSSDSPALSVTPSSALDDNYDLYQQYGGEPLDPLEAKRVLRKIDFRIVPILILIYLLQYLDKNGINYASVFGLDHGTHLTGQDYSWLGSMSIVKL